MNDPLTFIIFGATGDLYQNKLSVALWNLFSLGFLSTEFRVVGFARRPMTHGEFQNFTRHTILRKTKNIDQNKLEDFLKCFTYIQGDLENFQSFQNLGRELMEEDARIGFCTNKLFYLAVPPTLYASTFKNIAGAGLTVPCAPSVKSRANAWTRVLVEKPFGKDITEAKRLDKMLGELFEESQIFRIDHYLAKETMQNLLTFRFSNGVFESLWNNKNIEHVRIIFHEKNVPEDTLAKRGALYDGIGALRDVGQNHMLQMLALIAMENPKIMNAENIQDARSKVLEKVSLLNKYSLLRAQYKGYLSEPNIKNDSTTETFFRVILGINNKRWRGVPFEMESGKALNKEEMSIEVFFKKSSLPLMKDSHAEGNQNVLKFIIQPNEGIKFRFWFKRPGFDFTLVPQELSFNYSDILISNNKPEKLHDAYERVLYDCILGDQTLFTNTKEIMAEWKLVTDIIKLWQEIPLIVYKKGSVAEDIK